MHYLNSIALTFHEKLYSKSTMPLLPFIYTFPLYSLTPLLLSPSVVLTTILYAFFYALLPLCSENAKLEWEKGEAVWEWTLLKWVSDGELVNLHSLGVCQLLCCQHRLSYRECLSYKKLLQNSIEKRKEVFHGEKKIIVSTVLLTWLKVLFDKSIYIWLQN